jgi:hypothetical protein
MAMTPPSLGQSVELPPLTLEAKRDGQGRIDTDDVMTSEKGGFQ